jgi:hypothetical protein
MTEAEYMDIPVYVDQDMIAGAMTLVLDYPEGAFEVIDVISGLKDLMYKTHPGQLRIAWEDVATKDFRKGDVLLTLRIRKLEDASGDIPVSAGIESEFADGLARVFDEVKLVMPGLKLPAGAEGEIVLYNFPNPYRERTEIVYQIPAEGQVLIEVYNALGEKVRVLENARRLAGTYTLDFHSASMPAGVYSYKLWYSGEKGDMSATKTMVITK